METLTLFDHHERHFWTFQVDSSEQVHVGEAIDDFPEHTRENIHKFQSVGTQSQVDRQPSVPCLEGLLQRDDKGAGGAPESVPFNFSMSDSFYHKRKCLGLVWLP